jgi:hypothetical protein
LYAKAKSQNKKLNLYPDYNHTLMTGEPDDKCLAVYADVLQWMDELVRS